ncbi:MAG TPA: RNA polymerase factor sigma-54, partial [Burkholderiales bacterium]
MKPTLQFRLSQHLTLTPQLQQSIRLLQLSTVELNQEIERMLADNPILEREDVEGDAQAAFTPPRDTTQSAADAATQAADEPVERREDWLAEIAAPAWRGDDDEEGDRALA